MLKKSLRQTWQRHLIYGVLGSVALFVPTILFGNDIGPLLFSILLAAVICLAVLVYFLVNIRRHPASSIAILFTFLAASFFLQRTSYDIRSAWRWTLSSSKYKAQILSQPLSPDGELRHTEWDGWGFAGAGDTTVYLVFDPKDGLGRGDSPKERTRYPGEPCDFWKSHRLEKGWYTVTFYTDTEWGIAGCPT